MIGVAFQLLECVDDLLALDQFRCETLGDVESGVSQGAHGEEAGVGGVGVGVTEFELAPLGMSVPSPAVGVGCKGHDFIPADGLVGPTHGFGHRAPHADADDGVDGGGAVFCEWAASEVLPDDVGFVDPAHIAGGPDGRFDLTAADLLENVTGAELNDVDEDRSAGGGLNPGLVERGGDGVDPFGFGVVGPQFNLHSVVGYYLCRGWIRWLFFWSTREGREDHEDDDDCDDEVENVTVFF